ncbi:MAG: hypothetical protein WKG01_39570 [Kofleriaceae bacterium]
MRISLLVFLLACGKGDKPVDQAPIMGSGSTVVVDDAPRAAAGLEKLQVLVDGKQVPMLKAFVKRVSFDQWRVLVGDLEGSCEELLSGAVHVQKGGTSFVATIQKRLAADTNETTMVTDFSSGASTQQVNTRATFSGTTAKHDKVEITLDKITAVSAAPATDGIALERKLEISGPFTATGCGDQPETGVGVPKGAVTSSATITIAGKKLDLRGAILRGNDAVLSTGPKDCSTVTPFAPVIVEVSGGEWKLSGTWITKPVTAVETMKDVKFKVVDKGTTEDGPVVALELSGQGGIGGYPVQFAGTILALDCKP